MLIAALEIREFPTVYHPCGAISASYITTSEQSSMPQTEKRTIPAKKVKLGASIIVKETLDIDMMDLLSFLLPKDFCNLKVEW